MATLEDLKMELWLRKRNSGEITWTKRDGEIVPIKDMDDLHLIRTINMLERKQAEQAEYDEAAADYEAWKWDKGY